MVQVIRGKADDHHHFGGGAPLIHVHHVHRDVHGNGIAIRVYGEIKIAAKEVVFAKELKLNTLQVLVLTPEHMSHWPFWVNKWIHHKGEYDNYASIDIISPGDTNSFYEMFDTGRGSALDPQQTVLPYDGSIWLDFVALGE